MKKPLSRPEASDLLKQLLPDIEVSIGIIPKKQTKTLTFNLNKRGRAIWNWNQIKQDIRINKDILTWV